MDRPDVLVEPDPHRGVDDARSEGVHGDAVLDQAAGGCLSDGERAELRDAVRDEVPVPLPAGDRPGVDDLSARSLRDHLSRSLLGADDHAPRVDADDLVEVLLIDLHEVARSIHPGVVEDHVELAESLDGRLDHGPHLRAVGDVDADRRGGAAVRHDPVRDDPRRCRAEVGDDDLPALGCDRPARRRPDTAGAARDDHDAVLHTAHLDLLWQFKDPDLRRA